MVNVLPLEQRQMIYRLRAQGLSLKQVVRHVGCSKPSVITMSRQSQLPEGGLPPWTPREGHLMITDREQILLGLARGESFSRLARSWGRSASTVTGEVSANGGRAGYRAWAVHQRAR